VEEDEDEKIEDAEEEEEADFICGVNTNEEEEEEVMVELFYSHNGAPLNTQHVQHWMTPVRTDFFDN